MRTVFRNNRSVQSVTPAMWFKLYSTLLWDCFDSTRHPSLKPNIMVGLYWLNDQLSENQCCLSDYEDSLTFFNAIFECKSKHWTPDGVHDCNVLLEQLHYSISLRNGYIWRKVLCSLKYSPNESKQLCDILRWGKRKNRSKKICLLVFQGTHWRELQTIEPQSSSSQFIHSASVRKQPCCYWMRMQEELFSLQIWVQLP